METNVLFRNCELVLQTTLEHGLLCGQNRPLVVRYSSIYKIQDSTETARTLELGVWSICIELKLARAVTST